MCSDLVFICIYQNKSHENKNERIAQKLKTLFFLLLFLFVWQEYIMMIYNSDHYGELK